MATGVGLHNVLKLADAGSLQSSPRGSPRASPRPPPEAARRIKSTTRGTRPTRLGRTADVAQLERERPALDAHALEKHIFFLGVSSAFLKELAPLFDRRCIEKKKGRPPETSKTPAPTGVVAATTSAVVRSGKEEPREVYTQFQSPEYDGLFLSLQDSTAEWKVFFEGHKLVTLHSECVVGHEVALGLNDRPIFTINVAASAKQEFWFLPRLQMLTLVKRPEYAADLATLMRTADSLTNVWLKDHLLRCTAAGKGRFRLFPHMDREFHEELMRTMTLKVVNAGQRICTEGETSNSAFCVFQGEADVVLKEESLTKIAHGSDSKNWSAWWGLLECSGACLTRPASLVALNDCLVLSITAEDYKRFTTKHAHECVLFDKVALKHVALVAGGIVDPWREMPVLRWMSREFRQSLEKRSKVRVCGVGDTVVEELVACEKIMVVARGTCTWRIGAQKLACSHVGELTVVGVSQTVPAQARCDTVCDVREVLTKDFEAMLAVFPDDAARLNRVAKDYASTRRLATAEMKRTAPFDKPEAFGFAAAVVDALSDQLFLPGQVITSQGAYTRTFTIIVQGEVEAKVDGADPAFPSAPLVLDELSLLRSFECCAGTVKAISHCHCLCGRTEALRNLVVTNMFPEVAAGMRKALPVDDTGAPTESNSQIFMTRCKKRQPLKKARSSLFVQGASSSLGRSTIANTPLVVNNFAEGRKLLDYAEVWSDFLRTSNAMFVDRCSQMLHCIVFLEGQVVMKSDDPDPRLMLVVEGRLLVEALHAVQTQKKDNDSGDAGGAIAGRMGHVAVQAMQASKDKSAETENKVTHEWQVVGEIRAGTWVAQVFLDLQGSERSRPVQIRAASVVRAFEIRRSDFLDICEDFPREETRLDDVLNRCQAEQNRAKFKHAVRAVGAHAAFVQKLHKPGAALPTTVAGKLGSWTEQARRRQAALARGDHGRMSVRMSLAYGKQAPPEVLRQRASLARRSMAGHPRLEELELMEDMFREEISRDSQDSSEESMPQRLPGQDKIDAWVQRRTVLMRDAKETCSVLSLRRTGDLSELLPGKEGWRTSLTGPGTPFATPPVLPPLDNLGSEAETLSVRTCALRTAKTTSVYGRPVWSEVYGGPINMRPLLRDRPRQPKTAR